MEEASRELPWPDVYLAPICHVVLLWKPPVNPGATIRMREEREIIQINILPLKIVCYKILGQLVVSHWIHLSMALQSAKFLKQNKTPKILNGKGIKYIIPVPLVCVTVMN